jgi:hypothetical protein
LEIVRAFIWSEVVEQDADAASEPVDGSFRSLAEQSFELGKDHLDRIEVGRVGRQQEELGAGGMNGGANVGDLVGRQIVEHDDVAGASVGINTCWT